MVYNSIDHILNFIQNFQLMGNEINNKNSILFKSYKYSL